MDATVTVTFPNHKTHCNLKKKILTLVDWRRGRVLQKLSKEPKS
jgi:hypothetical protein